MVFLPTGEPVYEKLDIQDFHPPTLLGMLAAGSLTGYVRFHFPTAGSILLFQGGRLVEALHGEGQARLSGTRAIRKTFELLAEERGELSVYKLSQDLTASVHGLLLGKPVFEGQNLGIVNVKGVLDRFRHQQLTGCLRIYTDERTALIFYKEGRPLGFFHDGSTEIEKNPAESQNIAKLPGAKIDAYATPVVDEVGALDYLEELDVKELWREAEEHQRQKAEEEARQRAESERRRRAEAAAALEAELKTIVASHLGKPGRALFEKVLAERIGHSALQGEDDLERDLAELERAARLLTGASQTRSLLADVRDRVLAWRTCHTN